MTTDRLLLLAPRVTDTGLRLATAAHRRGLRTVTARSWRLTGDLDEALAGTRAHLYSGPLFADSVGGALGLALLEPPDDWLVALPLELTARWIESTTLGQARELRRPAFVKPPSDKVFSARIYPDGSGLPGRDVLPDDLPVLVSAVVRFAREYRLFVSDGAVRAASRYAVDGTLDAAPLGTDPYGADVTAFASDLLAATAGTLPSAAVVDVGLLDDGGWAVVEANPAWASGGYACDTDGVLDVVLRAAGPTDETAAPDLPFARRLPWAPL